MVRVLLPFAAALAACTPSPQETAMDGPSRETGNTSRRSAKAGSDGDASGAPNRAGAGNPGTAAQGPMPEPLSAAENPVPGQRTDSPAEAEGRRTLSTAFVRLGPDGHLAIELRNGRVLVLRDVVMGARDYCGVEVSGGSAGARYCGGYAEVAAARPGGGTAPRNPDPAVAND